LIRFQFILPSAAEGFVKGDDGQKLIALGVGKIDL
jgi:hypothetical protein